MRRFLAQHWFLLALCGTMAWAWLVGAQWTSTAHAGRLKEGAIMAIFLCTGLALRTSELFQASKAWRLHGLIQGISLILSPLLGFALAWILWPMHGNAQIFVGMVVCASLPTTIAFCVAMSRAAGANVSLSVVSATLGNIIGVWLTPLWLVLLIGMTEAAIPLANTLLKLVPLVMVPLLAGQLLRPFIRGFLCVLETGLRVAPLMLILVIIGISLASQRETAAFAWSHLLAAGLFALLLHGALLVLTEWVACMGAIGDRDGVTLRICASQKTLALGVPLIIVCFSADPGIGQIMLPILLYHPLQLLLASVLLPHWRRMADGPANAL
ncbi:MAG: hypothetical protein EA402_08920 [Planctomycetota bacterium]|nr:MAG: hypothetical protein EA402_08920 [Planctomycetota bacterium]